MQVKVYVGTGTHGCTRALTLEFKSRYARTGRVVEAQADEQPWAVGHDQADWSHLVNRPVRLVGISADRFRQALEQSLACSQCRQGETHFAGDCGIPGFVARHLVY